MKNYVLTTINKIQILLNEEQLKEVVKELKNSSQFIVIPEVGMIAKSSITDILLLGIKEKMQTKISSAYDRQLSHTNLELAGNTNVGLTDKR